MASAEYCRKTTFKASNSGFTIYGPYTRKSDGRKTAVICNHKISLRRTISWPKYLLCVATDVSFDTELTCEHIDNDHTNDSLDNLQWLSLEDNVKKAQKLIKPKMYNGICPECGAAFVKPMNHVKSNKKRSARGPFCGRSCAGIASHKAA